MQEKDRTDHHHSSHHHSHDRSTPRQDGAPLTPKKDASVAPAAPANVCVLTSTHNAHSSLTPSAAACACARVRAGARTSACGGRGARAGPRIGGGHHHDGRGSVAGGARGGGPAARQEGRLLRCTVKKCLVSPSTSEVLPECECECDCECECECECRPGCIADADTSR